MICLPDILPSSIVHCSCFTLQKDNSLALPEYITQAFSGHAQDVAFHPNLDVEAYMEHQPREIKGCNQGNLRSTEFLSYIPLKESMQKSAIVWQHCGEQLSEH